MKIRSRMKGKKDRSKEGEKGRGVKKKEEKKGKEGRRRGGEEGGGGGGEWGELRSEVTLLR